MKFTGERVVPSDMHKNVDTYQQHLLRYVWALKYVVNKNVFDAACGTGYGTHLMRDVANRVMGFDISQEAVDYAIERFQDPGYLQMDLDNPAFGPKDMETPIDVVVSFETIEHLKNPQSFIDWCLEIAPLVIGSIPINCPTEYHVHNYTCSQAMRFITNNFNEVEMLHQQDMILRPLHEADTESGMILFVGRR